MSTKYLCINRFKKYSLFVFLLVSLIFLFWSSSFCQTVTESRVLLDIPDYPEIFELDPGDSHTVSRETDQDQIKKKVKLISVNPFFEPNHWFTNGIPKMNYAYAEVVVEVDGERVTLLHRPYQMPITINGLRLFVETIKSWGRYTDVAKLKNIKKQARLSAVAANESWGPKTFAFPIKDYRWRSASYNNTWSSLVPYNKLYYHRGEDYGAIPDKLGVQSPISGTVIKSPLPNGDGGSNAIFIQNKEGIIIRMSHMNIETISPEYPVGTSVKYGDVLAKTGMTWDGRKSQVNDPHCHVELRYEDIKLASYPFMMEAYFRNYSDDILAVAGGYKYTVPGRSIILDGGRSLTRSEQSIQSYTWKLHNGKEINKKKVKIDYDSPGLYTEELIVKSVSGAIDRDFLQVRVYDENGFGRDISYGWVYHYPVRNIRVGTSVLFWERFVNTKGPVMVDFGDGTPKTQIDKETTHSYKEAGRYVVTFYSIGPREEPIKEKLEVIVEGRQ